MPKISREVEVVGLVVGGILPQLLMVVLFDPPSYNCLAQQVILPFSERKVQVSPKKSLLGKL